MVLERYAGVQTVAFCGVFPEIQRAWASVDNSLFLWRYDRWWADTATADQSCAKSRVKHGAKPAVKLRRDGPLRSAEKCC